MVPAWDGPPDGRPPDGRLPQDMPLVGRPAGAWSPQCRIAARPSGARQATRAGPGTGMTRGSAPRAAPVSTAQPAAVAALTASVKYMLLSRIRAARGSAPAPPGPDRR